MQDAVRVELPDYPCPCPGSPHALEWVDLEPAVTIPMGMAAMYVVVSMADEATEADLRGALAPLFVRFGIREWSFCGVGKKPVKVHPDTVAQLLPFAAAGFEVADKCMDMYLEDIIRPLVQRRERLSAPGRTEISTSASPGSGTTPPTPSSPSLPIDTAGMPSEAPVR